MTHRRLKPIRRGLGRHSVAKAPVADQRLQCETSHKPPLLNAVHLDRAAPNNLYSPPDEWLKRGKGRRKARLSALDQIADIGVSRYLHHRRALDEIGLF